MSNFEYAEKDYHSVIPWHYFRNGKPAHGKQIRALLKAINTMQMRSRVIVPTMAWKLDAAMSGTADGVIARAVYPASINGTRLCSRFVLHPTDDDTKSPTFKLTIDGVDAIPIGKSSATLSHNVKCASGYGATYLDRFVIDAEYEVTENALHEVELYRAGEARFGAWSIYEKEAQTLTSSDTKIDSSKIASGLPIVDTNLSYAVSQLRGIYDRQQGVAINVNTPSGTTAITIDPAVNPGGTYLLRSRWTDAYSSTTYKFAPVQMLASGGAFKYYYLAWAYGKIASGSDPTTVQFVFNNIGTETIDVDIDSGTEGYFYSAATEVTEAYDEAHDIDVIANCAGGSTGSVWAFGLLKLNFSVEP